MLAAVSAGRMNDIRMTFLSLETCGQPRSAQSLTVRHLMKAVYAMVRPETVQNGATNLGRPGLALGLPVRRREDVPRR
jgi:hypothetical protein